MIDQTEKLASQLKSLLSIIKKRIAILLFAFFILLSLFMIYKIKQFSDVQPTASQVSNHLRAAAQPEIDQQLLNKIQQLQNNNIQVKTLFENARNNPFSE